MSELTVQRHNQTVYDQLDVGDLVEFKRGLYSHWAVYIGNGEVVHLAGEEDDGINNVQGRHLFTISGKTFNKACVRTDDFWEVAGTNKAHRNNAFDNQLSPLAPADIVERALSKLGEIGYNVLFSNCEHFSSWCRYDKEKSGQVESFKTGFFVTAAVALTAGVVAMLGGKKKDKSKPSEY